jgi:3-oxoacyl-[acyl-carrier-protein] synthase III
LIYLKGQSSVIKSKKTRILAVGSAVPSNILSNKDIEKIVETSDEWIRKRTGICRRHVYGKGEKAFAYELGAKAALNALSKSKIPASEIDGIICATFTPDFFFPATACKIQNILGCTQAFGFDLSAACSGFTYALTVADAMITSGQCKTMLVVGVEIASKSLDWTDRGTCILFGDGAGAVVLQGSDNSEQGILGTYLQSDGSLSEILFLPAWGEKRFMRMNGNEVYKHAVRMMGNAVEKSLEKAGLTLGDVDLIVPHQANIRIIEAMASHLNVPIEKVVCNVADYGNTGSASIPIALEEAWEGGRVKKGTVAVFTSLGGGLAAGGVVVRF